MNPVLARIAARQVQANREALGCGASMVGHRERLTEVILDRASPGGAGRLCLLGAGNANDVDLPRLARAYAEIHLVDIDAEALGRARERLSEAERARVSTHAAVELSGMFDDFEGWTRGAQRFTANRDELVQAVRAAARAVAARLPGPFDTVVSCCMLTQIQLSLRDLIGDRDPAFPTLRAAMNAIHVRVLAGLVAPRGKALLATDMASSTTCPLDTLPPDADLAKLFQELVAAGNLFFISHPGLLAAEIRRDPDLDRELTVRFPIGPWLWQNGPAIRYLVYALELAKDRSAAAPVDTTPRAASAQGKVKLIDVE
jgi:hypothetical protein